MLLFFFQEEKETMCTNFIETVDICTNFRRRNETVDICTNFIVFHSGGERDCRHVY